jgi:energy-converting hydrogenase Eha subunit B
MAILARDRAVEIAIVSGKLVAAATRLCNDPGRDGARMGLMTAHARAPRLELGVIDVDRCVAGLAGARRALAHRVRGMAARALRVRRDARCR